MRIHYGLYPEMEIQVSKDVDEERAALFRSCNVDVSPILQKEPKKSNPQRAIDGHTFLIAQNIPDDVHAKSLNNLGVVYETGGSDFPYVDYETSAFRKRAPLPIHPHKAAALYMAAAELECVYGTFNLARAYFYGECGLAKNWQEAERLFIKILFKIDSQPQHSPNDFLKNKIEFLLEDQRQLRKITGVVGGATKAVSLLKTITGFLP